MSLILRVGLRRLCAHLVGGMADRGLVVPRGKGGLLMVLGKGLNALRLPA